jgi:signal transduction histidine kinase
MTGLSTTAAVRSGSAPFRARARLIRLLGEELISDEVMALVELVKNAYDADAQRVCVRLLQLADPASACVEVQDDGQGMDLDTLLHRWLEPATDHKRGGPRKQRTLLGRFPLGEKGVGRFAADKIGAELELITRPRESAEEIVLHVAWHHFDDGRYLDQIENRWELRDPEVFAGDRHGTLLRMRQLRVAWTDELLGRVRDGLMQLTSPNAGVADFLIELECPEFLALTGPIASDLLNRAQYRLIGRVDERGLFVPDGTDGWEPVDARLATSARFTEADGSLRVPLCGPFQISLYIWDLDTGGLRRAAMDRALREALRRACGIRIFRDGFRVWPYGEDDDDWLELNQRRVNNPTLRVSNNQIVGFIEITQRENPDLRDRTSREGMIDTPALFDLKALALGVLEQLEERRFAVRHEGMQTSTPSTDEQDEVLRRMQEARARIRGETGWRAELQTIEQTYRQQAREQQIRYEYVSRLAGLGLAAERMTNAFSDVVADASTDLKVLLNELSVGAISEPDLPVRLGTLARQLDALSDMLDLMEPLYRPSRSTAEPLDVAAVAQDALALFRAPLHELGVRAFVTQDRPVTVNMGRAHLMQVLICLIDNAIRSLSELRTADPRLQVHVMSRPRRTGIVVADNGPGIKASVAKLIFQPFYSGRREGAGLGLHVARDILSLYNSTLDLLADDHLLSGANFVVLFDRRRLMRRDDLERGTHPVHRDDCMGEPAS